ncbi:MAG: hypothetical protein LIO75_05705, partial [Lachnospiraceae bacterium]|nr:hypothetical protein [Lachnospiraceae bacterium]
MKKKLSKRGKKILAVVLALIVACSVLPGTSLTGNLSVFADEGDTTELTEAMFTCSSTMLEYTGDVIANPVSVASGNSLTEGTDYTCAITYSDDAASAYVAADEIKNVGYYKIIMTGMGSYAGTVAFDVTVAQSIADYTIQITGTESDADGLPSVGVISTDSQTTLVQGEDYTVTFYQGSDEVTALTDGTIYTLTVSGTGLYTGEITKTYKQEDASEYDTAAPYILTPDTGAALFGYYYNGAVTVALSSSQTGTGYLLCGSANGSADISANAAAVSSVACNAEGTNYFYLTDDSSARDQIYCYRVLVDSTAPTLRASLDDQGEWAQSKTIDIAASDSTSGLYGGYVYYAVGTNVLSVDSSATVTETQINDALNAGTLLTAAVSQGSAEIVITDYLDETGTTYYIYAIDNAGNVTAASVGVSRIDPDAPEITVDSDYAENGGFKSSYWKSGSALEIGFTVADDTVSGASSLGSVKVQKLSGSDYADCGSDDAIVAWDSTVQKYILTLYTEGTYRIVVTDEAGNAYTSGAFDVQQDSSAPEVSVDAAVNDAGYTVTDGSGNYCFADGGSLTLTLTVTDTVGESDTTQSDVTVSATVNGTTTDYALQDLLTDPGMFAEVTDNGDDTYTLKYQVAETGTVSISAADEINEAAEISVSAKKYDDEPTVTLGYGSDSDPKSVEDDSGTTIDYFNSTSIASLDILADITDGAGIAEIAYKITSSTDEFFDESGSKTYADVDSDVTYGQENTEFQDQSLADLSSVSTILTGLDDGSYTVTYTVTNVLGYKATEEISFSVDTAAPDKNIYVSYTSDSDVADASEYYNSGMGGAVSRLIDTLTARIFGKTNVYFTLYVKDDADGAVVSGINEDALIKDGNITLVSDVDSGVALTVNADSVTTARVDLTVDDTEMSGTYTMVRGVISTTSEDELDSLNHIKIVSVNDMAGNSLKDISGKPILGTENVVLDNVHPDVSVTYPAYNESDGVLYYYSPDSESPYYEEIVLTYTEKYFAKNLDENGDMILPSIQVSTDGGSSYGDVSETESAAKDVPYVEWSGVSDGTLTATLYLPYSSDTDGGEIEYLIQTSYSDGSGNVLTNISGEMMLVDEDTGLYQSETLALDNEVPMLVSYEISGTTQYQVDGVPVYMNVDGDDVTLTWVINDNDEYWDASRMTLTIRNKTTGTDSVNINGDDASVEWDKDGKADERLHTAEYTFDGDTDPANYEVVISYTDYAGN